MESQFALRRYARLSVFFLALALLSFFYNSRDVEESLLPASVFSPSSAFAARPPRSKNVEVSKQNGMNFLATVSMELSKVELRRFLERYSQLYEFEYYIDRRVDPTTRLSGSFSNETLVSTIDKMLSEVDLSYCIVDNSFLYIGPREAGGEALLLFYLKRQEASEEKKVPRQVVEKLNGTIDFTFAPYEEMSESFQALARRSRLRFGGFENIPFDRRRGATFKDVSVTNLLTVMLLGFNADYRYDSKQGSIKPTALNRIETVSRYYPKDSDFAIDKNLNPNVSFREISLENETFICATGRFDDMAALEYEYARHFANVWSEKARDAQDPTPTRKNTTNEKKSTKKDSTASHIEITGTIANKPLRALFDYLKKNSDISCSLDSSMKSAGITLDTRITCEFDRSDINETAKIIQRDRRSGDR